MTQYAVPTPAPQPAAPAQPVPPPAQPAPPPAQPANPFGQRPGQPVQPAQPSRLGGLARRASFTNPKLEWIIRPSADTIVRFDLSGLGDPFHRLLNTPLNLDYSDPKAAIRALLGDKKVQKKLETTLEKAWKAQQKQVTGAMLLYLWSDAIKNVFVVPRTARTPQPQPPVPPNANNQNQPEPAEPVDDPNKAPYTIFNDLDAPLKCLRSIDLALIFNVLARTRSQILLAETPLALEPAFLGLSLVTDDPRLVALVRATGCIEENW